MAHECIACGSDCYCSGDIDDCILSLTPPGCRSCDVCQDDDEPNEDEFDLDSDGDEDQQYARAATVATLCRQCGCHAYMACFHPDLGPCWWVENPKTGDDGVFIGPLCSHCAMENNGLATADEIDRPWKGETP